MCGIFGLITEKNDFITEREIRSISDNLFKLSESRGKEASGIALLLKDKITVLKEPIRSSKFIKKQDYKKLFNLIKNVELNKDRDKNVPLAIIGHSRLATNGLQTKNINNQPIVTSNLVGIHNGIVVNDVNLWKNILKKKPNYEVDTEALLELIDLYKRNGLSFEQAVQKSYEHLDGSATIAVFHNSEPNLILATNTGSLYFTKTSNPKSVLFASESYILNQLINKTFSNITRQIKKIVRVNPGEAYKVNLFSLETKLFLLKSKGVSSSTHNGKKISLFAIKDISNKNARAEQSVISLYSQSNRIKKLAKHDFDYEAIYKLKRCEKCVLPETTPFISFDTNGLCNYCKEHKKIKYNGEKELEKLVEPYRNKKGEPDCIIAFSGGRDSSYALHYLKRELGMNPIAFTYDWGMITDLARRNQSRMTGKLGVEHIIVSADISKKRSHIRKHIKAWMKMPNLGMVPLFLEGDKQCEYYANQLVKKTGIKLVFFARGNEFEREEFKTGHCGVKNADPKGVIHDLSVNGKIRLAFYYAQQYITNPAYINSSIFDTLFAYFCTYIKRYNYVFLWHYIPWKEDKIVSILKDEYGWETEPNTNLTWRTDDGTPAFYNYIYYVGQGFTENDSFRSRQVREGVLTRQKALELVNEENKPRHKALKWYFDSIGLDGDEVLSVVDNMPKLY